MFYVDITSRPNLYDTSLFPNNLEAPIFVRVGYTGFLLKGVAKHGKDTVATILGDSYKPFPSLGMKCLRNLLRERIYAPKPHTDTPHVLIRTALDEEPLIKWYVGDLLKIVPMRLPRRSYAVASLEIFSENPVVNEFSHKVDCILYDKPRAAKRNKSVPLSLYTETITVKNQE